MTQSNGEKTEKVVVPEAEEREQKCGWFSWRPNKLQRCYNRKMNIVVMAALSFFQGFTVNGLTSGNMSSWERRYNLPSSDSGFISATYDLTSGICAFLLSYAGHSRKPRWMMLAAATMGAACIVITMPQWVNDPYEPVGDNEEACGISGAACTSSQSELKYFIHFAQVLNGVAGGIVWTLGPAFVDNTVGAKWSPVYLAIYYLSTALGVGGGFIMNGIVLDNVYVDFWRQPEWLQDNQDPRWVGAWYISYIYSAVILFVLAVIFSMYDEELPEEAAVRRERADTKHGNARPAEETLLQWKNVKANLISLLTNPAFVCISIGTIGHTLISSGFGTFFPKIVQTYFNISAGVASIYAGGLIVSGVCLGYVASALLSKKFELEVRGSLLSVVISAFLAIFCSFGVYLHCPQPQTYGVTTSYQTFNTSSPSPGALLLENICNSRCGCVADEFNPLCDQKTSVQFFTPCYAGCSGGNLTNCECAAPEQTLTEGRCDNTCGLLPIFFVINFFFLFGIFWSSVPAVTATFRCVDEKQRAFALGIQTTVWKFCATVPGPIIVGYVLDGSCLARRQSACESQSQQSCELYDNEGLAGDLTMFLFGAQFITLIFMSLGLLGYKSQDGETLIQWFKRRGRAKPDALTTETTPSQEMGTANQGFVPETADF